MPPDMHPRIDEHQFRALWELSKDGTLSQRDLAARIGLSLGRINYVVRALIERGYVKAKRFKNSRNKIGYMYILTPHGIRSKLEITGRFLAKKTKEYERLRQEIEELTVEIRKAMNENPASGRKATESEGHQDGEGKLR